jgi:hypothetical protein
MFDLTVSYIDFIKFERAYFANPNGQRFGQMFINNFLSDTLSDPEVFYEQSHIKAKNLILAKYIFHTKKI